MEANLLPYLVALMAIRPRQDWDNDWEMATLISSRIAVTPAHAVPSGPLSHREGQNVFWLDFPQRPELDSRDVRVTPEAYDHDVDFAVLKLKEPLELPTADPVISAEPVQEGALWETLCVIPSSREGIPVHGRVEGIEIVDKRSLIKLSVDGSQRDLRGVGAPVMVDGKVIGIVWGTQESEPNRSSKARRSSKERPREYWYAIPISAMIESKKTDAIRKLLDQNQRSGPDGPPTHDDRDSKPAATDNVGAIVGRLGDDNIDVRVAAVQSLSEFIDNPQVWALVVGRLQDLNDKVRAAAVQALSERLRSDPGTRAAVVDRLTDENSNVRAAAVGALSEMVKHDAVVSDAVAKLLDDPNSDVRAEAVKVFAGMARDQYIREALTRRLNDENKSVRDAAAAALGAAVADAQEAGAEARAGPSLPPGTNDRPPVPDIGETAPDPAELDRESFFKRLSPSSRRALSHAAGMSRYFVEVLSSEAQGQSAQRTRDIPLAYLVAGLFEKEDGPTRSLLLNKDIDRAQLGMLVYDAKAIPLPSRMEYSPEKLDNLPSLTQGSWRASKAARDIADKMGSAQIQSRHLLYGALSIEDHPLVKLLVEAGVRREDVPLTEIATEGPSRFQTIARLNSDNAEEEEDDDAEDNDLLGINADVDALSAVIAVSDVATPLSIGLFGDWGSGKSFFMGKLRKRIFKLRDMSRAAKGKSAYCDNIVQIEFNAWSYQEGDLWASLVTDIFEGLAKSIDKDIELSQGTDPATAKARLLASMASAGDVLAEQERKLVAAENELRAGEQQFEALKKLGPKDVIKEAYRVIADNPEVKNSLEDAAAQLNIPEAERALGDLNVQLLGIKNVWSAFSLAFKGWNRPRDWIIPLAVLTGVVLLVWVGVPLVLRLKLDAAIAWAATLISSVVLALKPLAPVLKKAGSAAAIVKKIRESQQEQIKQAKEAQQAQAKKKLYDAQLRVKQARENLENVVQSLQEMRADKQLLEYVRERNLSTDYTSRLGTVARARRDFKQLSDLMDKVRLEKKAHATQNDKKEVVPALPRIDRIVLYIDDLDRCSEDKVVKVLEAVHLLLAFKLFVVIVAVDSRWLLHSLRQHSAAFRASNDGAAGISDEELAHWESTPLNYLEKIFQIPFYLRPMRSRGFDRLVHRLIGEVSGETTADDNLGKSPEIGADLPAIDRVPEQQSQQVTQAREGSKDRAAPDTTAPSVRPEEAGAVGTNEAAHATPKDGSSDKVDAETLGAAFQAQTEASEDASKRQKARDSQAEANPEALRLREWERDFMKKLYPLIKSPRSAKRFINIYRLMRVSITNERDLASFVGDKQGGQHRAALLLLAILTGYPSEATDILRDLLEEERPGPWWQYIDGIEASWNSATKPSTAGRSLTSQRRRELMDKLRLLRGEIPETQSCEQFAKWASKVARYSFESGRVLALTNDETDTD